MTEIDELEGVELAEAVAKARGWKRDEQHPTRWDACGGAGRGWCIDDGEPIYRGKELYSYRPDRDIAQAWELVEKMKQRGFELSPLSSGRYGDATWRVRFVHEDYSDGMPWEAGFFAFGSTAPTAICRAYLKAKEGA